jgi:hypothetical protein
MNDPLLALLALKLVAAKAQKLAHDLEKGRLWDGDLSRGIAEIAAALEDARRNAGKPYARAR